MSAEERKQEIKKNGLAWLVIILATLASIIISMNNNKLPATVSLLLPALQIDEGAFSLLMSINGFVGIVLAFIAASIILKIGTKKSMLVVLVCTTLGALLSAWSPSYLVLVIGRIFEAVGFSCVGTVVPVLISEWFPPAKRGLPTGIFSIWLSFGAIVIMSTSGFFIRPDDPTSYHAVFWFVAVLFVIVTIVWAIAVRDPQVNWLIEEGATAGNSPESKPKVSEGFKSPIVWVTMIAFAAFALGTASINNFENLYLVQTMGMNQIEANNIMNIAYICLMVGGLACGAILNIIKDKRSRLILLIVVAIILAACFSVAYTISGDMLVPWLIIWGLADGFVPVVFFTMVADIAPRPELASVSATFMSMGQCVGGILFAFVGVVITSGWGAATGILAGAGIVMVLGTVCMAALMFRRDRLAKRDSEK